MYLLIKKNKNPDKLILSSGKRTYINDIIKIFYNKKNEFLTFNKKTKGQKNLIGDNSLAKKTIGWKPNKNIILAVKEMYEN